MSRKRRHKSDVLEKGSFEPDLKTSDRNGWVKRGH